ncbi:tyrosinase [Artomyces pyxidatus]|uniref:Tyrosinase n=1 Tax=Artomyces pyxidatus TaxID=48021 RepID=A0ACB8T765_9AGAM|nr:tyrosinase [Artomyces pyxidatus]
MSHFIITGPTGGNTQGADAPNRLEINDLIKIQDQFSLYIQALAAMSADSQTDEISFFQIGGIHGLPYVQWEGSGGSQPVSGTEWGGYCTHGSVLFPTWHRPYVGLFEQVLQKHALDIAQTYTVEQQQWLAAAANLRAPYWDWATNAVPPPEVISKTTVDIITPDGKTTTVTNPLYQYTFHPIDPSFPSPYSHWKTTIRNPTSNGSHATTDVDGLISDLQSIQSDITSSIYNLLTRVNTWPAFSNHTPGDGGSSSNSLEAIHDEIHGTIGGQMGDPSVAGFDPIFFLHHANVDRMLSLWAALNPGIWVSKGPAEGGTFTIGANATLDASTALTPFWNSQTAYWASSQATSTSKLGYSYPEFNGLDMGNPSAVQAAIAQIVNQLYGGPAFDNFPATNLLATAPTTASIQSVPASAPAASSAPAATPAVRLAEPATTKDATVPEVAAFTPAGSIANNIYDWAARIQFKKYELGGSFAVLIFLGPVPEDPAQWRASPSFVGATHAFVNSVPDRCANCRSQADVKAEGFVHLNQAIAKHSNLGSFDPDVVAPYLKRELSWRVQRADKTAVPLSELPSLEVLVISTPLSLEPGAVFPVPGDAQHHHDVTHGRQGASNFRLTSTRPPDK